MRITVLFQQTHDLLLLCFRRRRTGAATASSARRKLHRSRSILVRAPRVGAVPKQGFHGGGATRANGTVQGRCAACVGCVWIITSLDQTGDSGGLRGWIPVWRARPADRRRMQRLGIAIFLGADLRECLTLSGDGYRFLPSLIFGLPC